MTLSKSQKELADKKMHDGDAIDLERLSFMPKLGINRATIAMQNRPNIMSGVGSKQATMRMSLAPGLFGSKSVESFDNIDFSKPEKFIREIIEYLQEHVNFETDELKESPVQRNLYASNKSPADRHNFAPSNLSYLKKTGKFSTMSGIDAQILMNELLKLIFDNNMVANPPQFKPAEINNLFSFLKYPYTIRNDAITAVGAPSSIAFLVKAIYWLFLIAKV